MSEKSLRARKRRDPLSVFLRVIVWLAAIITVGVFVALVGYILIKGVPNLSLDLFQLKYTSDNCSMLPAIFNTIFMTLLSLVVAVPLGIFSAIYLTEYAKRGNRLVKVVRLTTETLQGIPSIVYGLFGYLLPPAIPGILPGVILAIGSIFGETASLIYTAGTYAQTADSLFSPVRTLSVHMYVLSSEGLHIDQAYATAAVLLIVVVGINALSAAVAKSIVKRRG